MINPSLHLTSNTVRCCQFAIQPLAEGFECLSWYTVYG